MDKAIEAERKAAAAQGGVQDETDAAYEQCRVTVRRFDGNLAVLQCVEAIRSYAVSHGGRLPGTLAEITGVSVPEDPVSGEPFHYTRTGSAAVLESAIPPGGNEKHRIRYEIVVKN